MKRIFFLVLSCLYLLSGKNCVWGEYIFKDVIEVPLEVTVSEFKEIVPDAQYDPRERVYYKNFTDDFFSVVEFQFKDFFNRVSTNAYFFGLAEAELKTIKLLSKYEKIYFVSKKEIIAFVKECKELWGDDYQVYLGSRGFKSQQPRLVILKWRITENKFVYVFFLPEAEISRVRNEKEEFLSPPFFILITSQEFYNRVEGFALRNIKEKEKKLYLSGLGIELKEKEKSDKAENKS